MRHYGNLSPGDAIALVKSARLYQDALWISESQPAFSWLFFVSAIEIVANHWRKGKASPLERLKVAKPDLVKLLGGRSVICYGWCQYETIRILTNIEYIIILRICSVD